MGQYRLFVRNVQWFSIYMILIMACDQPKSDTNIEEAGTSSEVKVTSISENQEPDSLMFCLAQGNIGAGGNDLVSYFSDNAAIIGSEAHEATYLGVNYRFKNDEHLKTFTSNPEKYLPAYGGWCSMTLAMGRATQPTYDNFRIIEGKLHLFERTLSVNGQELWIVDPANNAELALASYNDYQDDGQIGN